MLKFKNSNTYQSP